MQDVPHLKMCVKERTRKQNISSVRGRFFPALHLALDEHLIRPFICFLPDKISNDVGRKVEILFLFSQTSKTRQFLNLDLVSIFRIILAIIAKNHRFNMCHTLCQLRVSFVLFFTNF
jgi:hypothetical protein